MRLKQYLTEMPMKSVRIENIVTKNYLKHELDTPDLEGFLWDFKSRYNITDDEIEDEHGSEEDFMETEEFMDFVRELLDDRFEDIKYKIGRITKGGYITIFREMTVKPNWEKNLAKHKHLGIFWSWDEGAAEAHWGTFSKGYRNILLITKVREKHVDWIDTFMVNIHPSYEEEKEIRLFKNTPIKIEGLFINGKEYDMPPEIQNKVFKA